MNESNAWSKPAAASAPSRHRIRIAAQHLQFLCVVLCLPALIFPDRFPIWAELASLIGLAIMPILAVRSGRRWLQRTPLDIAIVLMLVLTPLNLLISADQALTVPHVYKVAGGVALFYAAAMQ